MDIYDIELSRLADSPTQPRTTYRNMDEMTTSIKSSGVLVPILARPIVNRWIGLDPACDLEIVAGHRRVRGSRRAGKDMIKAIIRPMSDAEVLVIQLIENIQRDDMSALDEARAIKNNLDAGTTIQKLAKEVGKSTRYLYARLNLLRLQGAALAAAEAGEIPPELALLISAYPAPLQDLALKVVRPTAKDGSIGDTLSVRDARTELRKKGLTRDLNTAPFPLDLTLDCATACDRCTACSNNMGDDILALIGPGMCTSPPCWTAKAVENGNMRLEVRRDDGWTIVDSPISGDRLYLPTKQAQDLIGRAADIDSAAAMSCCVAWVSGDGELHEWVTHEGRDKLLEIIHGRADTVDAASTASQTGGVTGDAQRDCFEPDSTTSVATPRDHAEQAPVTLVPSGAMDAQALLIERLIGAVLVSDDAPSDDDMLLVCAMLIEQCAEWRMLDSLSLPIDPAGVGDRYDELAQRTPGARARAALACALYALRLERDYVGEHRVQAITSTLAHRYLPADAAHADTPSMASGTADMEVDSSASDAANPLASVGHPADDHEDHEAGHPAGASADPVDKFAAARAAGFEAGIAGIGPGSPALSAARRVAGIHPDSQEEHDFDVGWADGERILLELCAQAREAGRALGLRRAPADGQEYLLRLDDCLRAAHPLAQPNISTAFRHGHADGMGTRPKKEPAVAYRDPETGQTWTGRGLKPRWLVVKLDAGAFLSDFEVQP